MQVEFLTLRQQLEEYGSEIKNPPARSVGLDAGHVLRRPYTQQRTDAVLLAKPSLGFGGNPRVAPVRALNPAGPN